MKIIRVNEGKYSEIKLEDGKRYFISVLPDKVTIHPMFWSIPKKKIWEFTFPFYIRTMFEAWDTSKAILAIILELIKEAKSTNELIELLESKVKNILSEFSKEYKDTAWSIAMEKLPFHVVIKLMAKKNG
jgi:hypothetical protein